MDLLKKIELLLNAKTRAALPNRERHNALDEHEAEVLAEIRAALQQVSAKEQELAQRIQQEQQQAQAAEVQGKRAEQRTHQRRAAELERHLEQESIQAINLEEKLAALEQKLTLAKEAVEKEAKKAADRTAAAEQSLAQGGRQPDARTEAIFDPAEAEIIPDDFSDDAPEVAARKSRLAGLGADDDEASEPEE